MSEPITFIACRKLADGPWHILASGTSRIHAHDLAAERELSKEEEDSRIVLPKYMRPWMCGVKKGRVG